MAADEIDAFGARYSLGFANPRLLEQAFVHRSYRNEHAPTDATLEDNERLEFLGDAVLGFVVSDLLYRRHPEAPEGVLTHLRTLLVRRETLAQLAIDLNLGHHLLLGVGEENSGGRQRLATLCACFEALVGAIFMDRGLERVRDFVLPLMEQILNGMEVDAMPKDPKSRYQEHAQRTLGYTPRYKVVESRGPDHARLFTTIVSVKGEQRGVGLGYSKQDASQAAAAMALHRAGQFAPEYAPNAEAEAHHGFGPLAADSAPASDASVDVAASEPAGAPLAAILPAPEGAHRARNGAGAEGEGIA